METMMKKNIFIGLVVTIIMGSGCATTYDTEKSHLTGERGFYQEKLKNDVWKIEFTGNAHTDAETRNNYVLKKAAQITIKENYSFFKIIQSKPEKDLKETELDVGNAHVYGRGRFNKQPIDTNTFTSITVMLLKEKEGEGVYDANFIVNSKAE